MELFEERVEVIRWCGDRDKGRLAEVTRRKPFYTACYPPGREDRRLDGFDVRETSARGSGQVVFADAELQTGNVADVDAVNVGDVDVFSLCPVTAYHVVFGSGGPGMVGAEVAHVFPWTKRVTVPCPGVAAIFGIAFAGALVGCVGLALVSGWETMERER